MLPITDQEKVFLDWHVHNSQKGRWTLFGGAALHETLAMETNSDRQTIGRIIRALTKRGYLTTGTDSKRRKYIGTTPKLVDDANKALLDQEVRRVFGFEDWFILIEHLEYDPDVVIAEVLRMEESFVPAPGGSGRKADVRKRAVKYFVDQAKQAYPGIRIRRHAGRITVLNGRR